MNSPPRLSIGLPVYNDEEYLSGSIEALLSQSYSDFELIISDNASTDGTADICEHYRGHDARVRYFRQPYNIGSAPNHNFTVEKARGELFKWAASDDLYAPDLVKFCVAALDEHPEAVLAHSWSSVIDGAGRVVAPVGYEVNASSPYAPERFRSMLLDGWNDDSGGIIRIDILRRTSLCGSYHFADRSLLTEIGLYGPFYLVPERLFFRRDHAGAATRAHPTIRTRCANLDPRRADRLRNPILRLYAEYLWSYISAIHRAPLTPAERRECYRHLTRWLACRIWPVASQPLSRRVIAGDQLPALLPTMHSVAATRPVRDQAGPLPGGSVRHPGLRQPRQ